MRDAEHKLALGNLRAESDGLLSSSNLDLLGGLCVHPLVRHHIQHKTDPSLPLHAKQQHSEALHRLLTISNDLREA